MNILLQESYVRSDEFGRDLSSVQTLLTKQETFDIGLEAFENEGNVEINKHSSEMCIYEI